MPLIKKQEKEIFSRRTASKLLTTAKTMLLTQKQEKELFKGIVNGNKKAITELMNANLFLVESIAKNTKNNNHYLSYKTLVDIGKSGLRKAIDKYNSDKDYKFSTYTTWWIRQAIHLALGIKDDKLK